MAIDEATIQALKKEHGDKLSTVSFEDAVLVLRKPTRAEYKRFREEVIDEKKKTAAVPKLVKCLVVYPKAWEEVEAILDEYPGLEDIASAAAVQSVGASKESIIGKL
jgi:hypothetical protein